MPKLRNKDALALLRQAAARGSTRVFLDPTGSPTVRFDELCVQPENLDADIVRRAIDDIKAVADMPIGRDRKSAGQLFLNEDRFTGTVLVLTEPKEQLEQCELRLRILMR